MFQKISERIRFNNKYKKYIKNLKPLKGGEWDNNDKENKKIKTYIRKQLSLYQNNECTYCGLKLDETGRTEIEHIAPKGGKSRPKYPQFAYTTYNLVLACNLCNSPIKKGTFDTIDFLDKQNYKNCTFKIVHPYFDNPDDHIECIEKGNKVLVVGKTDKGKKTIDVFKLDNEAHCCARAKQILYEMQKESSGIEGLLKMALTYKKNSGF